MKTQETATQQSWHQERRDIRHFVRWGLVVGRVSGNCIEKCDETLHEARI